MNGTLLSAVKTGLSAFPGLRVGQLIVNALPNGKDLFYVTDEELAGFIWQFIHENYVDS